MTRRPRAVPGFAAATRSVARSRWTGPAVGVVVLVALLAALGAEPFLRGLRSLTPSVALAAVALTALATGAAAWRWVVVSRRFGIELPWGAAFGLYYRSQLLNTILPGGVLGDVGRAVDHGRRIAGVGPAARVVVVERMLGQLVQVIATLAILGLIDARYAVGFAPVLGAVLGIVAGFLALAAAASGRFRRRTRRELRGIVAALRSSSAALQIVTASLLVVGCHASTFVLAAGAVGMNAATPPGQLLALALVVLLAAALPISIGGWGPREGVAAWAFALAGYGAGTGVAAATLFGVLAFISVIPGAVAAQAAALIIRRSHRERTSLRGPELRDLPGRVHRHGAPAAAPPLERG